MNAKVPGGNEPEKFSSLKMPEKPTVKPHLDHLESFPKNYSGKMYILVVDDVLLGS